MPPFSPLEFINNAEMPVKINKMDDNIKSLKYLYIPAYDEYAIKKPPASGAISDVIPDNAEFTDKNLNLFVFLDICRVNVALPAQNIPEGMPYKKPKRIALVDKKLFRNRLAITSERSIAPEEYKKFALIYLIKYVLIINNNNCVNCIEIWNSITFIIL